MKKTTKFMIPAGLLALVLAGLSPRPATAQLDPGYFRTYVYENGVRVGEIYVPEQAVGQAQHEEDWVLYPNYVYPGPQFIGALQIVPSPTEQPYLSESDFFSRVPFAKGSKFIRVTAQENTSLPTR